MKKVLIAIMTIIVLLSMSGIAQSDTTQNNVRAAINTKVLGFNSTWSAFDVLVNITITKLGYMVYIEEYYTVDSSGNPKPASSGRYYEANITGKNITFQILRPPPRSGKSYNLVRGVVLLDGKRVRERWLNVPQGFDVNITPVVDHGLNVNEYFLKHEIRYKTLMANVPVRYTFTIPELSIYEVNVTSTGNESDVTMRIKLFSDAPNPSRPLSPGAVYKYLDIWMDTSLSKNLTVRYKVDISWISSNNMTDEDIMLFKWNNTDKRWHGSRSKITNKDGNYTYFESNTTSISIYAIGGMKIKKVVVPKVATLKPSPQPTVSKTVIVETTPENTTPEVADTPKGDIGDIEDIIKKAPGFESILAIVIVLIVYISKRR